MRVLTPPSGLNTNYFEATEVYFSISTAGGTWCFKKPRTVFNFVCESVPNYTAIPIDNQLPVFKARTFYCSSRDSILLVRTALAAQQVHRGVKTLSEISKFVLE